MRTDTGITRRTVIKGAAGAAAAATLGGPVVAAARGSGKPLWKLAQRNGVVFGTAIATWMFEDEPFMDLVRRQAALIFTMDDFLWYQLKPSRDAPLNFEPGDAIVAKAKENRQLLFGAHLVWDEGFGEGWEEGEMFDLTEAEARELLFAEPGGTLVETVKRYADEDHVVGWIVVNEIVANGDEGERGMRTDYPWYQTIGREFVAESFHLARKYDPNATLVLNEFGFETVNEFGDRPEPRRRNALKIIDELQRQNVPLDAFGIQGHLQADRFHQRFDRKAYRRFLAELADRGLDILITELDVLDDGLPADTAVRDRAIADIYERYLDTVLKEPAVKSVMPFGLSDRYTWLQEDFPREDGAERRPLPYDSDLQKKRAYWELRESLRQARNRHALWTPPRG
jgi:endo-1,4-beta-xylanase